MHILNIEPSGYSPEARSILSRLGDYEEVELGRRALLQRLGDVGVLIVRLANPIDRELLTAAPQLKVIVSATTGLDHIDEEYAQQRGIAVLSLRGEGKFLGGVSATAEHTWALLLSLVRRIPQAYASVRAGEWNRDAYKGHEIAGKRLGLLGLGRLGQKVAKYGLAFQMTVHSYDPDPHVHCPDVDRVGHIDELLRSVDILSLHLPLTHATRHLINEERLALLPRGALLVNTSRGELIDEAALLDALAEERLAGAALDVIEGEQTDLQTSPLLAYARTHDNLLVTPHIGGATFESMAKTEVFMANKLAAFLGQHDRSTLPKEVGV
jgi:D-3-phosphoglycerate dehydrogenase